jgi:hypothetical protein
MGEKNKLLNSGHLADVDAIGNITSVFEHVMASASEAELFSAANWYPLANSFCAAWGENFGLTTAHFAGIVAAVSPQLSWVKNREQAIEVCARLQNGKPLTGLMAYPANLAKAKRIFDGESPMSVLGGMKVRSFHRNLLLDERAVTIDRHAAAIALYGLKDTGKSGQIAVTDKLYKLLAKAYTDVAHDYEIAPYIVQSVTWTYKAANNGRVG